MLQTSVPNGSPLSGARCGESVSLTVPPSWFTEACRPGRPSLHRSFPQLLMFLSQRTPPPPSNPPTPGSLSLSLPPKPSLSPSPSLFSLSSSSPHPPPSLWLPHTLR
jgi:hypothetical protein